MSEQNGFECTDEISRRRWVLRLGEMVFLAGVSGLVPEALWSQLETGEGRRLLEVCLRAFMRRQPTIWCTCYNIQEKLLPDSRFP